MASANIDSDIFEVLDCQEFYPKFLDPISEDVRKELISVIHELSTDGAASEDASQRCEDILIKVENELGMDNFVCETVARELSECLRKLELVTDAIALMDSRLVRLRKRDFGTLMILASLYELAGNYSKALTHRTEALKLAELSGDPILISLSLVKQACDLWHLNRSDEATGNVSSCLEKLDDANVPLSVDHLPFTESVHRLIDLYKTLGYIHRFISDRSKSAEYYSKALQVVKQDKNARVHIFKLETQIACEYSSSKVGFKNEAIEYSLSAYKHIEDVMENESFMQYHTLTILHAMSRIAHSLQQAEADHDNVLSIRENMYNAAERYLSQNHPEIARIAADTAFLCCNIQEAVKESEYTDKARHALENCDNDLGFLKLHVREISDAWKSLALMYSKKKNFKEAERSFNEAIQVSKRVYGEFHPRMARLYNSLGHLHKRNDRFAEAIRCFTNCKEINDKFTPDNNKIRKQVKTQIGICKNLERKSYMY